MLERVAAGSNRRRNQLTNPKLLRSCEIINFIFRIRQFFKAIAQKSIIAINFNLF